MCAVSSVTCDGCGAYAHTTASESELPPRELAAYADVRWIDGEL